MPDDWRADKTLKALRQVMTCPICGSLVSTESGYAIHKKWHGDVNAWVQGIANNFDTISNYVTNPTTGLEKRLKDLIDNASTAISQLRTDATNAISNTNAAVTQLRTDATNAINSLNARVTALENKV